MIRITRQGRGPRMLGMMGVIMGCAVGFGAIKSPNIYSGQIVIIMSVATLFVATLDAILCTPKPFWLAFASVGWSSMLLSTTVWVGDRNSNTYLLGAHIWEGLDEGSYRQVSSQFVFGTEQFQKVVLPQIAIVRGLVAGGIALCLSRGRRVTLFECLGDRRPVTLALILGTILTVLAWSWPLQRFFSAIYFQLVTSILFAATIGGLSGAKYRTRLIATICGWCTLLMGKFGPDGLPSNRLIQAAYSTVYADMIETADFS